jgi:hypothetical protein
MIITGVAAKTSERLKLYSPRSRRYQYGGDFEIPVVLVLATILAGDWGCHVFGESLKEWVKYLLTTEFTHLPRVYTCPGRKCRGRFLKGFLRVLSALHGRAILQAHTIIHSYFLQFATKSKSALSLE